MLAYPTSEFPMFNLKQSDVDFRIYIRLTCQVLSKFFSVGRFAEDDTNQLIKLVRLSESLEVDWESKLLRDINFEEFFIFVLCRLQKKLYTVERELCKSLIQIKGSVRTAI